MAPVLQPWEISVPNDATNIELWFNNTDQTGCTAWDSRYGQNYWLEVVSEQYTLVTLQVAKEYCAAFMSSWPISRTQHQIILCYHHRAVAV